MITPVSSQYLIQTAGKIGSNKNHEWDWITCKSENTTDLAIAFKQQQYFEYIWGWVTRVYYVVDDGVLVLGKREKWYD